MSEREIQSWVDEARVGDRDDSVLDVGTPKPSNALDEWTSFLELSQRTLLDGRLGRLVYLNEKLLAVAERGDLDLIRALDLFSLLTLTYPRYVDVPSRSAVLNVLRALTHRDSAIRGIEGSVSGLLERIIKWIDEQASQICSAVTRSSSASSDRYILLTWCCALFGTEVSFTLNVFSRRLVPIMASLFDSLCDASTKDAIKRGALAHVRRTLRMHHTLIPDLINSLIGYAKSSPLPFVFAPMVGAAVDVSIRLKPNTLRQIGMEYIGEVKGIIMDYYMIAIFMSRIPVPVQARWAFRDFVIHTISEIDLAEGILPVIEKVVLRSPEIALPVVSNFLSAYNRDMPFDVFQRLLTASLHCGKSVNGAVRTAAIEFFGALVAKLSNSSEAHVIATNEILALPKASKTTGAEHRAALYAMLSFINPSSVVSPMIAFTLPELLAKESSEAAVRSIHIQLSKHFAFILQQDISVPASVTALFVKETTSQKALVRRAFFQALGNCFWILDQALEDGNQSWPLEAQKLVLSLRPALGDNIKTLGNSPLNAPIGPLEGYIAVFLGFCSPSPMPSGKTSILQGLALSTSKPSFLLWDKVYGKLATVEDELWFLRALSCALLQVQGELKNNEKLRLLFGYAFLHASVRCAYMEVRREALSSLKSLTCRVPHLFNPIIREALVGYILQNEVHLSSTSAETSQPSRVVEGLMGVVLAIASFDEATDIMVREELVAGLIILTHHPAVAPASRQLWIEATQAAQTDPAAIVRSQIDFMISRITESALVPSLKLATKLATKTLAFIAPEIVVPRIIKQINLDLDPKKLATIGQMELNIWKTEEGVLFLDVLHNKKEAIAASKGKDNDIEKWEAEVREIISTRKASSTTILSRQDRALVDAQLQKESATREAVQQVKRELERGLELVQSLVAAKIDQFQEHVWPISTLLLDGVLQPGFSLAASSALATYLTIASSCSSRLGAFRTSIGIATLRSLDLEVVPEDFLAEPLGELAVRLLYEIHSLSEKKAFDAASFSFMSLFLCRVLEAGGVGQIEAENALEQVTLALGIIQFHGSEFSNRAFPRLEIIRVLLSSISRYPQISKSAVSALVDIGNAMKATATLQERVVLIRGTLAQQPYVRNACLQAIQTLDLSDIDWSPELFLVCHDENKQNSRLAARIWEANYLDVEKSYLEDLLPFLAHENYDVRENCARALVFARVHFPSTTGALISNLKAMYQDKARILPPEYDGYGMLVERSPERHDPWVARKAVALTFEYLAEDFPKDEIVPLFSFLLLDEALGDRHPDVRRGMLNVGTTVINFHGKSHLPDLLSMFEHHLALKVSSSEVADYIREALVILLGRLAKHLDSADPRVPLMVDRLVEALRTPSEVVQSAVAECLSPLIVPMGNKIGQLMERLLQALTTSPKYAERRGAAYGLAGVIHGLGISALKEFSVITHLRGAMDDKKNYEARQGALFAFETMSGTLGRLFEPYIAQILPLLLAAYGDQIPDVREATQDASRVIMGNMSGYCLKLILPSLLGGLEEKQWRTKKGSIELLGAMAFLAPNQLSVSLPTVIPRLTSVLTDSHAQVRSAANKSLKQFGEVINNPEIRSLVPVLLKALVDPEKTLSALTALLRKSFVHYIDSPSLALLIPILERGMKERGAETKRKAAQIVGNMASLTDPGDFVPYLPRLIPLVHTVLVDPVPEARATAAKALGTLIERLGETNFPDLVSSLLQTLKTDSSGVDRQGAAQGLSEVLSGLGMDRMEGLLPDIVSGANNTRPYVREGFMSLLVFLPATFGHRFTPHLSRIIPPILSGLADAEEYVRVASMKAGRMIIANYSNKAIDLLLPELERGMFDSSWRIRHSSVTLVGELLYKVSGISGKNEIEEEAGEADPAAAESSRKALADVLGKIRRDRILGSLYIIRQDAIPAVRQASIHIWKALIHNTPRTVREILPSLIERITGLLATDGDEEHETAARTIGELCRKQGEKILSQIVPIFRRGADSPDPRIRQGVCLALGEVLQNTTDSQREGHEDEIISAVRVCLVDDSSQVRAAAAHVFDVLQEYVGGRAIDQTIPTLLEALCHPGAGSGTALQALREIMTVRASTVFPVLIPTLIASPITAFNAHALASLVTVAGTVLSKRLTQLLTALVGARESEKNEATLVALNAAISALVGSVEDAEGLHTLMMLLLGWSKHYSPIRRVNAVSIFATFCENTELEFSTYRADWIRQLVTLLDDRLAMVYEATWKALDEFVKSIDKSEMDSLVVPLRRTIESIGAPGASVPGFGMAKGISPMLPIIFAGLTGGSNEQREQAALAIADIVERTDENALRPYTTQLTGPLIRVITQATTSPPAIKSAILVALIVMLERIPTFVKPFFPQLQRTFVKALTDSSLSVRLKAVTALTVLMRSQPRVDPLVTELISAIRSHEDAIAGTIGAALAGIINSARSHVGQASFEGLLELVMDSYQDNHDDNYNSGMGEIIGALAPDAELVRPLLQKYVLGGTPPHPLSSQILVHTVTMCPTVYYALNSVPSMIKKVQVSIGADQPSISRPAREVKDLLRSEPPWVDDEAVQGLL